MSVIQIIAISLFVYLGSIGSIVGNTIGWYTLGRPLVASFVVGVIMGDLQTAMIVGIALQIMYMGNVTPGGAVAWDLSYATYIGTAGALVFGTGMESTQVIGLAVVFAGIGGLVGQMVWNLSYALNLPLNRLANKYAEAGETGKMYIPNVVCGQLIGLACRFIPAVILLTTMTAASAQADFDYRFLSQYEINNLCLEQVNGAFCKIVTDHMDILRIIYDIQGASHSGYTAACNIDSVQIGKFVTVF